MLLLGLLWGSLDVPAQHIAFEQTQDIKVAANIKSDANITSYKAKDGTQLQLNDIIKIGHPTEELGLLTIDGKPSNNRELFTFIYKGRFIPGYMMGLPIQEQIVSEGDVCIIEEMKVRHYESSLKEPLYVVLFLKGVDESSKKRTVFDYEKARLLGEIINPKSTPTKMEAINGLRESNDLYQLKVISKQKLDSIGVILGPIAKKNLGQLQSASREAAINEMKDAKFLFDIGIIDNKKYDSLLIIMKPKILK